ncbi:MAG: ribosome maturation factor RimM [Candidatus Dormibacteraeota bacterium]|nr:ribosome maturation factor RimM [Candidatus Dormibacteraeota bacterium]
MDEARILVGVVGRPHGVRGLAHVRSYTAEPQALAEYAPLHDDKGRRWLLAWRGEGVAELRDEAGRPLPDRTAAEALINLRLYVDRAQLPPAGEDEFYLADLVGMEARDAGGNPLGRVAQVHDYGAGASLELVRDGGPSLIVPFTRTSVPGVDMAARRLTVVPPAEMDAR